MNVSATTLLIFSRCNVDTSGASYTGAAAVYFMSANVRSISCSAASLAPRMNVDKQHENFSLWRRTFAPHGFRSYIRSNLDA